MRRVQQSAIKWHQVVLNDTKRYEVPRSGTKFTSLSATKELKVPQSDRRGQVAEPLRPARRRAPLLGARRARGAAGECRAEEPRCGCRTPGPPHAAFSRQTTPFLDAFSIFRRPIFGSVGTDLCNFVSQLSSFSMFRELQKIHK